MTFTVDLRSWSRMQRTKTFKAVLDAQYAGIVGTGTMARLVPVLIWSGNFIYILFHQTIYSQYEACWGLLALQKWQKCMCESNHACEIEVEFRKEGFKINLFWIREIIGPLNSSIEENGINIWIGLRHPAALISIGSSGYKRSREFY